MALTYLTGLYILPFFRILFFMMKFLENEEFGIFLPYGVLQIFKLQHPCLYFQYQIADRHCHRYREHGKQGGHPDGFRRVVRPQVVNFREHGGDGGGRQGCHDGEEDHAVVGHSAQMIHKRDQCRCGKQAQKRENVHLCIQENFFQRQTGQIRADDQQDDGRADVVHVPDCRRDGRGELYLQDK